MPEWGLTRSDRETKPYGLNSWWLEPGKVITDPIHGEVFVTRIEQMLLDTPPLQRLRRVRQLGTTQYVYPGATHTRFSHSLGAIQVVQSLLDAVVNQRNRTDAPADLFAEWETVAKQRIEDSPELAESLPELEGEPPPWLVLCRQWQAEATVLARLGALLHDIGHLPFGHTIEDDLALLVPHDESAFRFEHLWGQVISSCEEQIKRQAKREEREESWAEDRIDWLGPLCPDAPLHSDLKRLVLAKERNAEGALIDATKAITYPFVADMVGNTICADLLDYLQRDHVFSGLPISLGRRYIASFYITPKSKAGIYKRRMVLLIHRDGRERKDVVTEILKHLRYRYELQERVLVHHTKLSADAMVGKMIELWLKAMRAELTADPSRLDKIKVPRAFTYPGEPPQKNKLERATRWSLEDLFLRYGDDGVLERIARSGPRFAKAAALAQMLLDRTLYKPAAEALRPAAAAGIYREFGSSNARRNLERAAAEHAELAQSWYLVLWIPDPDMRLKLAELLVDDGKGIAQFKDKSTRGSDIYDAHKDLWTASVFVHPEVPVSSVRDALAKLAKRTGVSWDAHRKELGPDPDVAPEHLAAVKACELGDVDDRIQRLVKLASPDQLAARGEKADTQKDLDRVVGELLSHLDEGA